MLFVFETAAASRSCFSQSGTKATSTSAAASATPGGLPALDSVAGGVPAYNPTPGDVPVLNSVPILGSDSSVSVSGLAAGGVLGGAGFSHGVEAWSSETLLRRYQAVVDRDLKRVWISQRQLLSSIIRQGLKGEVQVG